MLKPKFRPDVLNYTLTEPFGTENVTIDADAELPSETLSIDGAKSKQGHAHKVENLKGVDNTITIEVQQPPVPPDELEQLPAVSTTYTIKAHVKANPPSPQPQPEPEPEPAPVPTGVGGSNNVLYIILGCSGGFIAVVLTICYCRNRKPPVESDPRMDLLDEHDKRDQW